MPNDDSAIEWTDSTWNPIHGCAKVSAGCTNCYAADLSLARGWTDEPWSVGNAEANVRLQEHHLGFPDTLDEPQRVFVNSMSDLFLPEDLVPDEYLHRIMDVVERNPEHAFIALTKHGAETGGTGQFHPVTPRLIDWDREHDRWPDNLWMGVSVASVQREFRIEVLRRTGAATKWVSFEPLVERIPHPPIHGMDWVVVGGESAPDDRRREMDHAWAREIRGAARGVGAAFYFKQSSGPRQGHEPALAEAGTNVREAPWHGAGATEHRELPPLPEPLREARPGLAAAETAPADVEVAAREVLVDLADAGGATAAAGGGETDG